MKKTDLRGFLSYFTLAASLVGCGHSNAEQPPPIVTSYTPEYVQTHRFICKTLDAEFSIRSVGPTKSGPPEVTFESAKFNGTNVAAAEEIKNIFELINHTELISGECLEQIPSVGAVISAVTKTGDIPRIRMYVDFTQSGVTLYELACSVVKAPTELPGQMADLCRFEK